MVLLLSKKSNIQMEYSTPSLNALIEVKYGKIKSSVEILELLNSVYNDFKKCQIQHFPETKNTNTYLKLLTLENLTLYSVNSLFCKNEKNKQLFLDHIEKSKKDFMKDISKDSKEIADIDSKQFEQFKTTVKSYFTRFGVYYIFEKYPEFFKTEITFKNKIKSHILNYYEKLVKYELEANNQTININNVSEKSGVSDQKLLCMFDVFIFLYENDFCFRQNFTKYEKYLDLIELKLGNINLCFFEKFCHNMQSIKEFFNKNFYIINNDKDYLLLRVNDELMFHMTKRLQVSREEILLSIYFYNLDKDERTKIYLSDSIEFSTRIKKCEKEKSENIYNKKIYKQQEAINHKIKVERGDYDFSPRPRAYWSEHEHHMADEYGYIPND